MKKLFLLLSLVCLLTPAMVSAQYSNASLNGPWITYSNTNNGGVTYIIFDGAGHITQLGTSDDTLSPVGTYSVTGPGVISATLNLVSGQTTVNGQLLNDSSANMTVTGLGSMYAYKVQNLAALTGTWSGPIFDTSANYSKTVTLTVSSTGVITAATGITGLIAGHIFLGRDTFAGYIITTDDSCAFHAIHIAGLQYSDSLLGGGRLGSSNSNCGSFCFVELVRTSNSIATIPTIDFSVYPNPFTERIEISLHSSGSDIQADLYDLYGRKVLSRSLGHDPAASIDASMFSSGMYMLTLTDSYGITSTKRVIKK